MMKISGVIGVVLWAVALYLAPHQAAAASQYDGSVPLLCVPLAVTECGAEGECQKGTARSVNLPQFLRVDVPTMTIRSVEEGRESPIGSLARVNGSLILQGVQGQLGWTLIISEAGGQMSATIGGAAEGYLIFGSCTLLSQGQVPGQ
jgi:hypothetical protein